MLQKAIKYVLCILVILLVVNYYNNEREYFKKIKETMPPKITHLTKAIVGTLRYQIKDHNITDDEVIKEATKQDPDLMKPFDDFAWAMKRTKRNLIIIMGPKNRSYCMFQDYSWTDNLDFNFLESGEKIPFEITSEVPLN